MGRSGSPGAGSMESSFELGGHAFAAEIEWDNAMRLVSLRVRSGREPPADGQPLVELFAADGTALASERRPGAVDPGGAAYVLERVRAGDLDVRCELKPRSGP